MDLTKVFCANHKLQLDETLTLRDLGVSAFTGENRTKGALSEFLKAIVSGRVNAGDVLVLEHPDRFSREDWLPATKMLLQVLEAGVGVGNVLRDLILTSDSNIYELFDWIQSQHQGHEESAKKVVRVSEAWDHKRKAAATKPLTANCPAWLRLDGAVRPLTGRTDYTKAKFAFIIAPR